MANITIQHKRGLVANLPQLLVAELAFTTDTKQVFIGNGTENLQLALTTDLTAGLDAAKAYTDNKVETAVTALETKMGEDIQTAIAGASIDAAQIAVATPEENGLFAKEDKVILDRLVGKEADFDAKETTEGAQAKADAAEANAKAHADGKIEALVGAAPETLDTIHELAAAITALKQADVEGLVEALSGKADKVHTHQAADVVESAEKRFVSDAQIAAFAAKAEAADIATAVTAAKTEVQGSVDTLAARVVELENATVIDGGTF